MVRSTSGETLKISGATDAPSCRSGIACSVRCFKLHLSQGSCLGGCALRQHSFSLAQDLVAWGGECCTTGVEQAQTTCAPAVARAMVSAMSLWRYPLTSNDYSYCLHRIKFTSDFADLSDLLFAPLSIDCD